MSYDSKHSGAVAEQMLDDYVAGNLGGEGGAKVYHFDLNTAVQVGTIGQEIYDAILAADIVMVNEIVAYKEVVEEDGSIRLYSSVTANGVLDDPSQLASVAISCIIEADLSVTTQVGQALIPTKTSELTNDSGFITAEESPKIYHMATLAGESGTVSQEVYDAILAADVVVYGDYIATVFKEDSRCVISYILTLGATVIKNIITINQDLTYTFTQHYYTIPTTTSELTNDSNFITAADIPPSGGLPTEVIELSSEVTLQEGKMLEIGLSTPVTGSLSLRAPTIEDPTRGLLFGIRFYCGGSVPQITFAGGFSSFSVWANGELPQLEPNSEMEILGCKMANGGLFLLTWAIYKA